MTNGRTIIEGGYIKTDLLDVNKIFAKQIKLQNTQSGDTTVYGSIYGGERYNADGSDNDTTSKGFYLGADGILKAKDGYFEGEINATSGTLDNITVKNSCVFNGKVSLKGLSFSEVCSGDIKLGQIYSIVVSAIASSTKFTASFRGEYLLKLNYYGIVWETGNVYVKINSENYKTYSVEKTSGLTNVFENLLLPIEVGDVVQLDIDSKILGRVPSFEFYGDIYTDLTEDLYMYQQSLKGFSE